MRSSLLPVVLILLLLGLVFLLPRRDEGTAHVMLPAAATAGQDVAAALLSLPALELIEPPTWVLARGDDELLRSLDRLAWGTHQGMLSARDSLARQKGGLDDELLSRLRALGDSDPILVSKLVAMFDPAEHETPEVVEELVSRALSDSALVAKAALRALSRFTSPESLGGILDRRNDPVLEVRAAARAALAARARGGDEEALGYLLQEVESTASDPDLAYLTVLGEVTPGERLLEVLRLVADQGPLEARLVALGALVIHGDEGGTARLEATLESTDVSTRLNAWHLVTLSGRVLGRSAWDAAAQRRMRQEVLLLMSVLNRAITSGDDAAPKAAEMIEAIATDPNHPCQTEAIDLLFAQGHPWAVERTRAEILDAGYVGPYLAQTVDRIERTGGRLSREFGDLAFERLSRPDLGPVERVLLCRLVCTADPLRAADPVLRYALEGEPRFVGELLPYLPGLGEAGLARLAGELGSDRGAGLYVYLAATTGNGAALPQLEAIALDEGRDPAIRRQALDCIVRLDEGPREEALRRVALALHDPAVAERARLLFWNYL